VGFRANLDAMTLRHAPLWAKVLLTPAIVLIAMLVMAAVAIINFTEQDASVRRLDTAVFERLRLAMEARDGVTLFQAGLSDFTSVAANETDDARHKQIADTLLRQADSTAALVQKLADRAGDASDGHVDEIVKAFAAYRESALPVIDMAQSNASYAVLLMGDVSSRFLKLRQLLEGYVTVREGQRQAVVSDLLAGMSAARRNFLFMLVGAAAFSGLAAWFIVRLISRPVTTLTRVMGTLAAGQMDTEVPGCEQRDELGEMARAVEVFKEAMRDATRLQAEREANSERAVRRGQHLSELVRSFEEKVSKILGLVSASGSEMQTAAATMTKVADSTTRQTDACANAAQQASVVAAIGGIGATIGEVNQIADTVASGIEEQGSATMEIARNVQAAADGAQEVSGAIEQIAEAAATTGGAAEGVSEAVRHLSDQSEALRREIDLFLHTVKAA